MKFYPLIWMAVFLIGLTSSVQAQLDSILPADLQPITPANAVAVTELARLGRGVINGVALAPASETLAVASSLGIWLHNVADTASAPRLLEGQGGALAVALSSDGERIASGGQDNSVVLWDTATGEELARLLNHIYPVSGLAFSADSSLLASGDVSGIVRLWDAQTYEERAVFQSRGVQSALTMSPDGSLVAAGGSDYVRVWDVATGELRLEIESPGANVRLAFNNSSTELAIIAQQDAVSLLWLWATDSDAVPQPSRHDSELQDVRFDQSDVLLVRRAFVRGADTLSILNPTTGDDEHLFEGLNNAGLFARFNSDDDYLTLVDPERGRIDLLNLDTDEAAPTIEGYSPPLTVLEFEADNRLITRSEALVTQTWNLATGTLEDVSQLTSPPIKFAFFQFLPDGTINTRDPGTGEIFVTFSGHTAQARTVVFSPNQIWLASGANDATARIWNAHTGEQLAVLHGHIRGISNVTFSPDSSLLASASYDGTIILWDTQTYERLATLEGHTLGVTDVAFNEDGTLLASTSFDGTVRLWGMREA